MFVLRVVL